MGKIQVRVTLQSINLDQNIFISPSPPFPSPKQLMMHIIMTATAHRVLFPILTTKMLK